MGNFKKDDPTCSCCGDAGCVGCYPCKVPANALSLTWTNVGEIGDGTATLSRDPTGQLWQSDCIHNLRFVLACTGGLRVDSYAAGDCSGTTAQTCAVGLAVPRQLVRDAYTCCPFYIHVQITETGCPMLWALGFRSFTIASPQPTPQACCCTGTLTVSVTDACRHTPIAGAPVTVTDQAGTVVGSGVTGDDGKFAVKPPNNGGSPVYTVTAGAGGCSGGSGTITASCYSDTFVSFALYCQPFPPDTVNVSCCGMPIPGATVTVSQGGTGIFSGTTDAAGKVTFTRVSTDPLTITASAPYCLPGTTTVVLTSTGQKCGSNTWGLSLQLQAAYVCCFSGTYPPGKVWPQGIIPKQLYVSDGLGLFPISPDLRLGCGGSATGTGPSGHVDNTTQIICDGMSKNIEGADLPGVISYYGAVTHKTMTENSGTVEEHYNVSFSIIDMDGMVTMTVSAGWGFAADTTWDSYTQGPPICIFYESGGFWGSNGPLFQGCGPGCPAGDVVIECEWASDANHFPPVYCTNCGKPNVKYHYWYRGVGTTGGGGARGTGSIAIPISAFTPDGFGRSVTLAPGPLDPKLWVFELPAGPGDTGYLSAAPPPPGGTTVTVTS